MTEIDELKSISDSLLRYLISIDDLQCKSAIEIYNNWTSSTQTQITFANNVRWALRFIKTKKIRQSLKMLLLKRLWDFTLNYIEDCV